MSGAARLLLDTHILLWSLAAPERLSLRARDAIENPSHDLLVSAASAWELATKFRIGRLPEAEAVVVGYEAHVRRLGAVELPVSATHTLAAGLLAWDHRDPFDRLLAVQSMIESATLVTADAAFEGLAGVRVLR